MPHDAAHRVSTAAPKVATNPALKPQRAREPAEGAPATTTATVPVTAASKAAEAHLPTRSEQGSGGTSAGAGVGFGGGAKPPFDWDDIGLGSLVLAQADDEDAWYFARVVATKADDHFVLTWADYTDWPEFSRPRRTLGLLHPGAPTRGR